MRKLNIILIVLFLLCTGCKVIKLPPKQITEVHVVDSIVWKDSTIYTELPIERIIDIVPSYDTLILETTLARSETYLDTNLHALRGIIENKDVELPVKIKWKERTVIKDSIQIIETPVEVVKTVPVPPKSYWWFLVISIISLGWVLGKNILKFIKK